MNDKYYESIVFALTITRMLNATDYVMMEEEFESKGYTKDELSDEEWKVHLEYECWKKRQQSNKKLMERNLNK